jgi:hypothetical protein
MTAITSAFSHARHRERPSAAVTALALVQLAVGYEWLVSGLSKVANGDFPGGLAAQLRDLTHDATPWYGHFLTSAVVPHAAVFGYGIEIAELGAGAVLVAAAVSRLAGRPLLRRATIVALVAGIVMVANFELANGGAFGLHLASDSFDEGVDLDTIMVGAQLALLVAVRTR